MDMDTFTEGEFGLPDSVSQMLVPGTSVGNALNLAGITQAQQVKATFVGGGSLFQLYKKYRTIIAILARLGLGTSKPLTNITYLGGLEITSMAIMAHLKWSPRTFDNKFGAFEKAALFAQGHTWKGPIPAEHEAHLGNIKVGWGS